MDYQLRCWHCWAESALALVEPRLPRTVAPEERLDRFVTRSGDFSPTKGKVKAAVLVPGKDQHDVSVFRTSGLEDDRRVRIGWCRVARVRRSKFYGWATFAASAVTAAGLTLDPDDKPPRHTNVKGWPAEKDARLLLGAKLYDAHTLHLLDAPIEI